MSDAGKAIFLSYAHDDVAAARRIAEALRSSGLEVWFDENELRGGDAWDSKIRKQINDCALFVPLISQHTESRPKGYFRLEWKLAVEQTHLLAEGVPFVAPVAIDDTRETGAVVPAEFLRVQWTRLPGALPTPQFVEQIKRLLTTNISPGMTAPPMSLRPAPVATPAATPVAPPAAKSRIPIALVGGLAVAVLALLGYITLRPAAKEAPPLAAPVKPIAEAKPVAVAPVVDPKSIAVLPFENMSEDKDSAFFADGIHEDVLTNLGIIRELHVTSRTSVMEYRGTTKKIRQIASELGVAYILEGSVRRAGNKVRVTGQLIRAATDEHVWAKAYDRDLTDIFAIQSELSQAIAAALSAAISPQEKSILEIRPTTNPAAYDLFLKARANFYSNSKNLSPAQVEQLLTEAVKLDPAFAQAWGHLAWRHARAYFDEEDHSPERLAQAKAAIDTAVRLAPDDPDVIEMRGNYYYYGYRDYVRAAEQYQRLLRLRPNSADAHAQLGYLYRRQGHWGEALASLRKAAELDPRDGGHAQSIADTLQSLRRFDEAAEAWRHATELAAGDLFIASSVPLMAFYARGTTQEMEDWLKSQIPVAADETKLLYVRRGWARTRGDWAQAVAIDRQHPYLDPWDDPHWTQDANAIFDLVGNQELPAAHARAKVLIPQLDALTEKQPANGRLWSALALLHALEGDKESALRCARKPLELVPESADALIGPANSMFFAQILAWTGDKDGALAELARLLRQPSSEFTLNVFAARVDPGWLPLRGDSRFEALLNDPKNNAPSF
jgi:TolB-like protein/Flp pilus assembly protein TadD